MNQELNRKVAPPIKQITNIPVPKIGEGYLDNQIKYYTACENAFDLVFFEMCFKAGHCFTNARCASSIANGMLTSGTTKHDSKYFAETLDFYGIEINTFHTSDFAGIQFTCLDKHLDIILPLLCEIITESTFPENELKNRIDNMRSSLKEKLETTSKIATDALMNTIFDGHPYSKVNTIEGFNEIKREQIIDFYKKYYNVANCHLFLAGHINDKTIKKLNDTIGQLPVGEKNTQTFQKVIKTPQAPPIIIKKSNAVQTSIRLCATTIPLKNKDSHILHILLGFFGGYFGSRLMKNIREEKGYTYGIGCSIEHLLFSDIIAIGSDIKKGCYQQVLEEIKKEIDRLRNEPISDSELTLFRNYLMGTILECYGNPLMTTMVFASGIRIGTDHIFHRKKQEAIMSITASDLQDIANKYLNFDNFFISVVGDE